VKGVGRGRGSRWGREWGGKRGWGWRRGRWREDSKPCVD